MASSYRIAEGPHANRYGVRPCCQTASAHKKGRARRGNSEQRARQEGEGISLTTPSVRVQAGAKRLEPASAWPR